MFPVPKAKKLALVLVISASMTLANIKAILIIDFATNILAITYVTDISIVLSIINDFIIVPNLETLILNNFFIYCLITCCGFIIRYSLKKIKLKL